VVEGLRAVADRRVERGVEALAAHPFLLIDMEHLGRVVLHSEVKKQE
jgi:hypothetical protein